MTGPDAASRSLRARLPGWAAPLLLGALCLLVYNANLRTIGAGDTLPARYQPLILWHDGTLDLDANARLVAHGHPTTPPWKRNAPADTAGDVSYVEPWAYWMTHARGGQLASLYPVVAPLLVAPLYLPAALLLDRDGWRQPQIDRAAEVMEKLSASLLAAIASLVMYLVLRREGIRWALPLALVFAFGTDTWMISSQALWQHGSGELLVALALLLAVGRASPLRMGLLGFVCVLIAANRPPDVVIAGAFLLYAVWRCKRDAVWLLAGAAAPLAALLYYNLGFTGHLAGAYAAADSNHKDFFHLDLLGLPGLLVSPARGLLVFSPFLVFIGVGLARRLRTPSSRALAIALGVAVVLQLLIYSQADWRAGTSWGPRWLTDLLPILVWMLAPAALVLRPLARRLLVATMVAAVGVQAIGAFWYTKTSDDRLFAGDPASMRATWDPSNTPFVVELHHPHAPGELQCGAGGEIQRLGATLVHGDGAVVELKPGMTLIGWALTCGRTPAQALLMIDGTVVGTTQAFVPRPDVDRVLHTTAPSGWSVAADTRGVRPGKHVLQLAVRLEPRSDIRIIREQAVTVAAPPPRTDLRALAARAARQLRDDQNGAGYWLTSFTSGPRYEAPQKEMNTYLTSILVDLLAPVARKRGLDDAVARARRHLAAQIESDGLVRYHGLPDGPTIGTLGCVITPDADDTALAWRLAGKGAGDPRARRMLRTLARYRDARGLYRTWLAPQRKYQCLDPGRNPDPADLVIGMHVYLMLRELDRPAARSLCEALKRAAGDDDAWVYYAKAPLVGYLRSAQLRQLGCRIALPTARLARRGPGQELWSELVRRLVATSASRPDASARRAIDDLLGRLGSDDFALIRRTPPLLYHNDLSATVNRFYWSQDAGYALWLRLYEAAQ
ncbi:MAG: hypothetical protein QOI73_1632 [Solirubrobacteraceae bacterium]|nr:hypothetical protein [Solirubrobacteraceae bacterium]